MTTTLSISLPKIYDSLFNAALDVTCVEHAPMNCRISEVVGALVLSDLLEGRSAIVCGPYINKVKNFFLRQIADNKIKITRLSATTFCFGLSMIHFQQGFTFTIDELPINDPDRFYSLDSHLIRMDVSTFFPDSTNLFTGHKSDPDHWFYEYCKVNTPLSLGKDAIEAEFSDQKGRGLKLTDPYYDRQMLLQDVTPKWGSQSFREFSKKRLKIKTDKAVDLLSSRQREQALSQHGVPVVTFEVSQLQKKYLDIKKKAVAEKKKPWFILLKYRRGGFTTIEQGMSYHTCTTNPRSSVITLAHTRLSTERIFKMVSLFQEKDPEAQRLVGESKSSLEFENGSNFFIGTAGGKGVARGDTLHRVHGSEVSKWCEGPNQMADVDDLLAGLLGAASFGEVVLESTPNGREWFCHAYMDAKKGLNDFTPIFVRWFDDPINRVVEGYYNPDEIRDTINEKEANLILHHDLDMSQVAFRREAIRTYGRLFAQEMPEDDASCFMTSGSCFFDTDKLISKIERQTCKKPIRVKSYPAGTETVWEEPQEGTKYCMGVDTSEGIPGCDPSGVGILNKDTGEQVLSLHGLFNPKQLAEHTVRLSKLYNDALIGVERQNHGHAVLLWITETYKVTKPHFRGGPLYYYQKAKSDVRDSKPGWSTDAQSRPIMLDQLGDAVDNDHMIINDEAFIHECLSFRLQRNRKFEADPGAKDDSVMKWAIAFQMFNVRVSKPSIGVLNGR